MKKTTNSKKRTQKNILIALILGLIYLPLSIIASLAKPKK